jgi:hypothetical protein
MLVANDRNSPEFHDAPEHMGCNIRTVWVVAEVFGE